MAPGRLTSLRLQSMRASCSIPTASDLSSPAGARLSSLRRRSLPSLSEAHTHALHFPAGLARSGRCWGSPTGSVAVAGCGYLKQTARSSTKQVQPAGGVDFLCAYQSAASSILVAVNCNLPSTSLTVPVAVTFLLSLQSFPWNSL